MTIRYLGYVHRGMPEVESADRDGQTNGPGALLFISSVGLESAYMAGQGAGSGGSSPTRKLLLTR